MREADQQVWNRQLMDSYLLAQVVSCCVQETISGQSYKHSTIVIYQSTDVSTDWKIAWSAVLE